MARSGFGTNNFGSRKTEKVPDSTGSGSTTLPTLDNFQAYEGYESLTADPNVDIVYIGGINPLHHKVAKMALNAGKEGGL